MIENVRAPTVRLGDSHTGTLAVYVEFLQLNYADSGMRCLMNVLVAYCRQIILW